MRWGDQGWLPSDPVQLDDTPACHTVVCDSVHSGTYVEYALFQRANIHGVPDSAKTRLVRRSRTYRDKTVPR